MEDALKVAIRQHSRLRLPDTKPVRAFVFLFDESCAEEKQIFEGFLSRELAAVKDHILVSNADKTDVAEIMKELRHRKREKQIESSLSVIIHICARTEKKTFGVAGLLKGAGAMQYIHFANDSAFIPSFHRSATLCLPLGEPGILSLVHFTFMRLVSVDTPTTFAGQLGFAVSLPSLEDYLATVAAQIHSRLRPVSQNDAFASLRLCAKSATTALGNFLTDIPACPGLSVFPMNAVGLKKVTQKKIKRSLGETLKLLYGGNAGAQSFVNCWMDKTNLENIFHLHWDSQFESVPLDILVHWLPSFIGNEKMKVKSELNKIDDMIQRALAEQISIQRAKPWSALSALTSFEALLLQYFDACLSIEFWKYAAEDLMNGVLAATVQRTHFHLNTLFQLLRNIWPIHPRTIILQNDFRNKTKRTDDVSECLSSTALASPKMPPDVEELLEQAADIPTGETVAHLAQFALGADGVEPGQDRTDVTFISTPGLPPRYIAAFAVLPFAKGVQAND